MTTVDLRLGRWQDVLADVERVDLLLADPPFSERTHSGALGSGEGRSDIAFAHWTAEDVEAFVDAWAPRVRCWFAIVTDDVLVPSLRNRLRDHGLVDFPAVPIVFTNGGVRMQGDGPCPGAVWLVVARQRGRLTTETASPRKWKGEPAGAGAKRIWRATPSHYIGTKGEYQAGGRGKPRWLLDALVRDYSDPGMTVCDPFAGWGSTLVAARNAGRIAIGSEQNPTAHATALAYLSGNTSAFESARAAGRAPKDKPDDAKQLAIF